MFGHDNQGDATEDNSIQVSVVPSSSDPTSTPVDPAPAAVQTTADQTQEVDELNLPAPAEDPMMPSMEVETTTQVPDAPEFIETPAMPQEAAPEPMPDEELSTPAVTISTSGNMKDLSKLKSEALHELSPLIGHLDQTPEEKYATAKMVYEETNDQALLTAVYDAAKNLPNDKAKAEAIYDVIQKINAFSN